jgi:signal peptide peptidase SppA
MSRIWAGTEEAFELVAAAEMKAAGMNVNSMPPLPSMYHMQGGTAVLDISGPLIDGSAGGMRYFGVTGYDDIAGALIEAASSPDTHAIMLNIDSPGGDVNGVIDMSSMISKIAAIKPMAAHTSGQMSSAAYWLGSSTGGEVTLSPTAMAGSIGVLTVHTERSAQLEQEGVKVTVLRSGDQKALRNPIEPLSAAATADIQQKLADVHQIFRAGVAKARPQIAAENLHDITQGQEFMGKRAVAAGLADKVTTLSAAIKALDKAKVVPNNPKNTKGNTMKTSLTNEQLALIASGAPMSAAGVMPLDPVDGTDPVDPTPEAVPAPVVASVTASAPASAPVASTLQASDNLLAYVQSQLVTSQAELVATKAELLTLKATTQTHSATHESLLNIARVAVGNMQVALGNSNTAESLDAVSAIDTHARMSATFKDKFKVGGVAAPTQVEKKDDAAMITFLARLEAAKPKT